MKEEIPEEFYELWETLPVEVQNYLKKIVEESPSKEQFISAVMVGECPKCGSTNTVDCDGIQGIEDSTLGLCRNCGYFWCLECGSHLTSGIICGHWEICDNCDKEEDEFGGCGIPTWECQHIKKWLDENLANKFKNICAWCDRTIPENSEVFGLGQRSEKGLILRTMRDELSL